MLDSGSALGIYICTLTQFQPSEASTRLRRSRWWMW